MIFHLHFSNLKDKDRKIKTYEPRKEIIFQILIQKNLETNHEFERFAAKVGHTS